MRISNIGSSGQFLKNQLVCGLVLWLLHMVFAPAIYTQAVGNATGSLDIQITSPMTLPPDLYINRVGTIDLHALYPNADNGGNGSLVAQGSATCSPPGCLTMHVGADLEIQLSNDLTATANPDGSYGGAEDAFSSIDVSNETGVPQTIGLRFTSDWSISASVVNPAFESAEAFINISWAVPETWCIELASCANGTLIDPSMGNCPAGFEAGGILELANAMVNTDMGNASDSAPVSNCDVNIIVPDDNLFAGGGVAVYSEVLATSCQTLILSNNTITQSLTEEGCKVQIGPDYAVEEPNGNLTVNAYKEISITNNFSVDVGSQLSLNIIGYPSP